MDFKKIDQARKILGLGEKATLEQIRASHRQQVKKWHPDKCKKKDKKVCHEKMKEINRVYKIIRQYIENYTYSFAQEKVIEESPEERWKKQFGKDPMWGHGWE